jgi:hypothetical protein
MTENAGTTAGAAEAQTDTEPTAPVTTGTPQEPAEVTLLKSRAAGLDAKVTELMKTAQAAEDRAAEAAQKLADYEAGKVSADEALRAQLEAKEAELTRERQERAVEKLQQAYPETFGVFGAAAAGFTADQLAASEARLSGVAPDVAPELPVPVGNSPARRAPTGTKAIEDMTRDELDKHLKSFDPSVIGYEG